VLTISGVGTGLAWDTWVESNPECRAWAAQRWLTTDRRLPPVPDGLGETRRSLHRLATYVIAPTRHVVNGKFGLRFTLDGFGTPFFGADRQIRVEGNVLVDQRGDELRHTQIDTLRSAAEFLETKIDSETAIELDSTPLGDPDERLVIDLDASRFLGSWFGMATAALEVLRADPESVDPSRPQVWPGHFDAAAEVGDADRRASYGASPGDESIDEPYLYVSLRFPDRLGIDPHDEFWNAESFTGRALRLTEFPEHADPVEVVTGFFSAARQRLSLTPLRE
jgi:hypothetical protein